MLPLLVLAGILTVAVSLRLWRLADWPLEQDELYTLRDSADYKPGSSPQRPVYFALQHLLFQFVPVGPTGLRLLPFLFGVGGVAMTWKLGTRWLGITGGLVAAFLVAVSPWHLYESQVARYWTLVYFLAALYLYIVALAFTSDNWRHYALAGFVALAGTFTHPTFLFPMAGVLLGVMLVPGESGQRKGVFWWRRALGLSVPPFLVAVTWLLVSSTLADLTDPYPNRPSRGLGGVVRLVPAVVQWLGPEIVMAFLLAIGVLYLTNGTGKRRWAAMAILGTVSTLVLMLFYSVRTEVYADYAMSMLPLIFVAIGGAVEEMERHMAATEGCLAAAAISVVLAAGVLPGTVSHLLGGSRFEYRPALQHVQSEGPNQLVVGWPGVVLRYYASDLRIRDLSFSTSFLDDTLNRENQLWLVLSFRRYGFVGGARGVMAWVDRNCRKVLETRPPRFDYREYRVNLYHCASETAGTT